MKMNDNSGFKAVHVDMIHLQLQIISQSMMRFNSPGANCLKGGLALSSG